MEFFEWNVFGREYISRLKSVTISTQKRSFIVSSIRREFSKREKKEDLLVRERDKNEPLLRHKYFLPDFRRKIKALTLERVDFEI